MPGQILKFHFLQESKEIPPLINRQLHAESKKLGSTSKPEDEAIIPKFEVHARQINLDIETAYAASTIQNAFRAHRAKRTYSQESKKQRFEQVFITVFSKDYLQNISVATVCVLILLNLFRWEMKAI